MKSVINILEVKFDDNDESFHMAIHRLERVRDIWILLTHHLDILETMTPMDFLDFRNSLRPASGFQSLQFKSIEAILGLTSSIRYSPPNNENYYKRTDERTGGFTITDRYSLDELETSTTLFEVLKSWLHPERFPFFKENYWSKKEQIKYWESYQQGYIKGLSDEDKKNSLPEKLKYALEAGITISNESLISSKLNGENITREYKENKFIRFDSGCVKSALFILINRDFPVFHLPYKFLNVLTDIDEAISIWRQKHLLMVNKTIGKRAGTGMTSGSDYLRNIVIQNEIFSELKILTTFLVERSNKPPLPEKLMNALKFSL